MISKQSSNAYGVLIEGQKSWRLKIETLDLSDIRSNTLKSGIWNRSADANFLIVQDLVWSGAGPLHRRYNYLYNTP